MHERSFMCLTCGNLHDAPKVKGITAPGHRKAMWCVKCKKKRLHIQVGPITMEDKENMAKCLLCGKKEAAMQCICGDCLPKKEKRGRLPKAELDAMIAAERTYYHEYAPWDEEGNRTRLDALEAARKVVENLCGFSRSLAISNFLGGLLTSSGLGNDLTNREIYTVLGLLGWEIYEEQECQGTTAAGQSGGASEGGFIPTGDMECDGAPAREEREGMQDGTDL